MHEVSYNGRTS